jgi:hypothetical protein
LRWMEVLPFVLAASFLVARYGAVGAAIAWSVRVAIDASLLLMSVRRLSIAGVPVPARLLCCVLGFAFVAIATVFAPNVALRISMMAIALLAYTFVAWNFALATADRQALVAMMRVRP